MQSPSNILGLSRAVVCVVGPTASGKTALAQELALRLKGEVVSADSMQIYKGMDIGTGKPSLGELKVRHYGFDLLSPGKPYSAALFQAYARACFVEIDAQGKTPLLCGGTGFYVRAALDGYEFPAGEQLNNDVRNTYNAYAYAHGPYALWELLQKTDAQSAKLIAPNDTKRVVRAFELLADGTSYAAQHEKLSNIPQVVPAYIIGLAVDPQVLNERIDARVDEMIERGLVSEVKDLLDQGFRDGLCAPQAIGYKEIVRFLDGEISLDEAVSAIKQATHRYGKRQRTWFRKDARIRWLDANEFDLIVLADEAQQILARTTETAEKLKESNLHQGRGE